MTAGRGYPRGPLAMLDDLGASPVLAGLAAMHHCYGDAAFAPPPLLREHAAAALAFCG
jgi:3-hydroxyacyl-CoA dehydrogenase